MDPKSSCCWVEPANRFLVPEDILGSTISAAARLIQRWLTRAFRWSSCQICSWRSTVGPSFSRHLEHADGAEPGAPDFLVQCHACILAQACNFGLTRMAQLADLSYRQLAWCTTWYLREETLQPAITSIVNHQAGRAGPAVGPGGGCSCSGAESGDLRRPRAQLTAWGSMRGPASTATR